MLAARLVKAHLDFCTSWGQTEWVSIIDYGRVAEMVLFYTCLPNFVEIGRSVVELSRHIEFSR